MPAPWARDEDERRAIEAELAPFVAREVVAVREALDQGFELDLGEVTWSAIWKTEGHNAGLWLYPGHIAEALTPTSDVEWMDRSGVWHEAGADTIRTIVPSWVRTTYGPARRIGTGEVVSPAGTSDLCLEALAFRFESGADFVLALGATPDEVVVHFSLDEAIRAHALRGETCAALGLMDRSDDLLVLGIAATVAKGRRDAREIMIALAPFYDAAKRAGLDPARVFDRAAAEVPGEQQDLVHDFGARGDVTLGAFGFTLEEGPFGPRYRFVLARP